MSTDFSHDIRSENDVTFAVIQANRFCQEAGFDSVSSQMIATATSELVRNILKYAGSGKFYIRQVKTMLKSGIEVEVIDTGPGIKDCDLAMLDHYSSSGTLGLGLPAVKRIMDEFTLESAEGKGTRVMARKWIQ